MPHTQRERRRLRARLARIRGQVDAVDRALVEDCGCSEVLQQVAAIRGAVAGLMRELLEGHVREHLASEDRTQDERARAADELTEVLGRYLR